jgi:hypothetical protein
VGGQTGDPLRAAFEAWEKPAAAFWDQFLRSPLVLQSLNQSLEWSLGWQRAALRGLDLAWQAWGLPTAAVQQQTLHRLNQLHSDVQRLSRAVDRLAGAIPNEGAPPG